MLLPALLALVTWRQSQMRGITLPLFWTGENLVNVSVYIKDAPFKKLHLLAGGLIHDWNWLLNGDLETSATLSDMAFGLGILLCAFGIGAGLWLGISDYRLAAQFDRQRAAPRPKQTRMNDPDTWMR